MNPCFDVLAQEFWVTGIGNYFDTDYVPIDTNYNHGQSLIFETPINNGSTYFHFSADVQGEIYFPRTATGDLPLAPDQLFQITRSRGKQTTLLKLLIEYPMQNNKMRRLLMDVGSGVDIIIPPTTVIRATLLQPSPDPPPGYPFPAGFVVSAQFAAVVVLTAQCVQSPSCHTNHATYTQPFAVSDGGIVDVDVAPEAKTAMMSTSSPMSGPLLFMEEREDQLSNVLIDRNIIGSSDPIFAGAQNTLPGFLIPASANILRYASGVAQTGSIVQRLEW